jgi:hypothetical protein
MGLTTEVYIQYTTFQSPYFPYRPSTLPEGNGGLPHPVINMAVPAGLDGHVD